MSPTEETDEDEHGRGSYDILRAAAANELDCEGVRDLMSSCRLTIDLEVAGKHIFNEQSGVTWSVSLKIPYVNDGVGDRGAGRDLLT